jgi:hypothetical protein
MPGESAPCTAHSEVNVHSDRDHVPPLPLNFLSTMFWSLRQCDLLSQLAGLF